MSILSLQGELFSLLFRWVFLEPRKVGVGQIYGALWADSVWNSQEQAPFKMLC